MKNNNIVYLLCTLLFLLGFVFGAIIMDNINYNYNDNGISVTPNERTLNQYATFESSCSYRGYDRDECLLIWSGR